MLNESRHTLMDRINQEVLNHQHSENHFGLILIDIREFHIINSGLGLKCGDFLIQAFRDRLSEFCPENGKNCFHLADDEFALVPKNLQSASLLPVIVSQLLDTLKKPFNWQGQDIALRVNLGYSFFTANDNVDNLFIKAERKLLQAKKMNVDFVVDDGGGGGGEDNRWQIGNELLEAFNENEFRLFYQPKLNTRTGHIDKAEALLRWQPQSGPISIESIITIAESMGLALDLAKWTINTALREMMQWPAIEDKPIGVAVNLSASVIDHPAIPEMTKRALNLWGASPERLTFEITESAVIEDKSSSFNNLQALRQMGIKISIDDFGTGFSSLEYFRHIPCDEIKIDKSFVFNMLENSNDNKLVRLIIEIGRAFDLDVVAEGVETAEISHELQLMGVHYIQGYFLAKPAPSESFIEWLQTAD